MGWISGDQILPNADDEAQPQGDGHKGHPGAADYDVLFARGKARCTAQPDQPGPGDGQGEGNRHTSGKYADPGSDLSG